MTTDTIRVDRAALEDFCARVFQAHNLSEADATIAADVLVAADARGIPSHGVARLPRYVLGLATGLMLTDVEPEIVRETPTSLLVNARGAMGAPVSAHTMNSVIDKARQTGAAFGCIRDSNHFGIAGYYAMLALPADMLGIAMTNTAALGVPTFGREPFFGTNPLAFAAPADEEGAFVLDMATTVVTRGKVEVYDRAEKPLPEGWAVDAAGLAATDPTLILQNLTVQAGGGILPLGGLGELFSGHKGYGLAVMVDILCGVLAGSSFGADIADQAGSSARVSHFFGAIRIDTFRDPRAFRRDMDHLLRSLRSSPPAEGEERVYFAGLKEFEYEEACAREGIPLTPKVYAQLKETGAACEVAPPAVL